MFRIYKTCNPTVGFSKYDFLNNFFAKFQNMNSKISY